MSNPPALPAPGGNATAALSTGEHVTTGGSGDHHSGAATTTEGDMSYLDEDEEFDPCRQDPRREHARCLGLKR